MKISWEDNRLVVDGQVNMLISHDETAVTILNSNIPGGPMLFMRFLIVHRVGNTWLWRLRATLEAIRYIWMY